MAVPSPLDPIDPLGTNTSFKQLLGTIIRHAFTLFFGYLTFDCIYNLFLHPLRSFPGPVMARASNLYSFFYALSGHQEEAEYALHILYGPFVRARPNQILIADPAYIPTVYHLRADKDSMHMGEALGLHTSTLAPGPWEQHAMRRRRIAGAYSMTNIKRMEPLIDARIMEFTAALDERFVKTGETFDFAVWANYYTYDVVSTIAFGEPFGFVRTGTDVASLLKQFHGGAGYATSIAKIPAFEAALGMIPGFSKLWIPKPTDKKGLGALMGFRDKLLDARMAEWKEGKGRDRKDLLSHFLAAQNLDGTPMTREEIAGEALLIMIAGSDTTATTLRHLLFNLLKKPEAFEKLRNQIDKAYDTGKLSKPVPTYAQVEKEVPFLWCCLQETLRIAAPVAAPMGRVVSEPIAAGNLVIPVGAEVGMNPWVVHRHEETWGEDCEEFRPERWEVRESERREMEKKMLTFGGGARVCLGKGIALMEVSKVIVELLRKMEWEIAEAPKGEEAEVRWNTGTWQERGYWVRAERRDLGR
ncbi:cytochrome P450 monooxygenase [Ascobolus immersus RN42]|uniref:Cytochrome P450 monooxygenase n=1 Tax=Ascobolus immersus RN42 TaxID=1160509 RepID=A0A3N4HG51_ASCIM|nr:cytochrome P450 monooxygenase [Ascobolus immersus RN42]